MSSILPGIIVLVVVTSIISAFMIFNLKKFKEENLTSSEILQRLAPFLIADLAFMVIFVVWLIGKL